MLRDAIELNCDHRQLSLPSWPQSPHSENKTVSREGPRGAPAIINWYRSEILIRFANSSPEVSQHSVDCH